MDKDRGVSIIVPTFNRPGLLRESLINLNKHTQYTPKEIIVVDGGSEPVEISKYEQIKAEGLCDKMEFRPYFPFFEKRHRMDPGWSLEKMRNFSNSYLTGLDISNKNFPYVHFGADDLLYRTGWVEALIEMVESDWAKKYNVKLVSGFNHWCNPNDRVKMIQLVPETYKSKDGLVEGYASEWGGTYFLRKDEFEAMGRFKNNVSRPIPWYYEENCEVVLRERFLERGWHWGTTVESYVQTMTQPSLLGNCRRDGNGNPLTDEHFCNGVAIGYAWKDI